jgi:hypothetical protein
MFIVYNYCVKITRLTKIRNVYMLEDFFMQTSFSADQIVHGCLIKCAIGITELIFYVFCDHFLKNYWNFHI